MNTISVRRFIFLFMIACTLTGIGIPAFAEKICVRDTQTIRVVHSPEYGTWGMHFSHNGGMLSFEPITGKKATFNYDKNGVLVSLVLDGFTYTENHFQRYGNLKTEATDYSRNRTKHCRNSNKVTVEKENTGEICVRDTQTIRVTHSNRYGRDIWGVHFSYNGSMLSLEPITGKKATFNYDKNGMLVSLVLDGFTYSGNRLKRQGNISADATDYSRNLTKNCRG